MLVRKLKKEIRSRLCKNGQHVERGIEYCEGVCSGDIEAGEFTRLSCERHLLDLERLDDDGFGFWFSTEEAERATSFIELLPHTKGRWGAHSELITLEPWQCFIITSIFGWLRAGSNLRRFRVAYICVPRKNGKSIIAAGIGLYMLTMDGEYGAEVYSGATTEKQAWEVFKPAKIMLQRTPALVDAAGIDVMAKAISIPEDGAKFEPVIGNPGDGASPHCAIIDEYHEHDSPALFDTMITGMGAREQPLALVITTAGNNVGGPCYELQRDCERVLDGTIENDELFSIIYHADQGDEWDSPDVLVKANPNYGVSVFEDFLLARQREAIASPAKQNTFRTKHLNQWVSAKSAWLNMITWNKCADESLKLDDFDGLDSIISIDLASKIDIAVWLRLIPITKDGLTHYYVFPEYYLPEETVNDDKTGRYKNWVNSGHLIATDGDEIDIGEFREDITAEMAQRNVEHIVFDPWRATQMAQELQSCGANTTEFRQTVQNMSPAMFELEAAIKSGRLHHDGNPVTNWMVSNVVAKIDAKGNIYPRKERKENKIDGIVALLMAIGISMTSDSFNAYEMQGLRVI